ncbi:MAG: rhamnan synthesis F family protein [Rhodospirillaceae bacterium]
MPGDSIVAFHRPAEILPATGERYVSGLGGLIEIEHYHRYLFAYDFCKDKVVLDIASGEGYGSHLLSTVARSLVGVDMDPVAVAFANRAYASSTLSYCVGLATALPIRTGSVDVAVSFETIEHIADHERFFCEICRVLRPGGVLIASSPDRDVYSPSGDTHNPFHVQELTRNEFTHTLRRHFTHHELYGQVATTASLIMADEDRPGGDQGITVLERRQDTQFSRRRTLDRPMYLIAVASAAPVPHHPGSVLSDPQHLEKQRFEHVSLSHSVVIRDREIGRREVEQRLLGMEIARLTEMASARDEEILRQHTRADVSEQELYRLSEDLRTRNQEILRISECMRDHDQEIMRLSECMRARDEEIARREGVEREHRGLIAGLTTELDRHQAQAADIFSSTSWRATAWLRWLSLQLRQTFAGVRAQTKRIKRIPGALVRIALLRYAPNRLAAWGLKSWVKIIEDSGFFDSESYLHRYPDVAAANISPVLHYLRHGTREHRSPGAGFDQEYYLAQNADVASSGLNPLLHYLLHGRLEGRSPRVPASGGRDNVEAAGSRGSHEVTRHIDSDYSVAVPLGFFVSAVKPGPSLAVFCHIYYEDLAGVFRRYFLNIPAPFDLFISTDEPRKQSILEKVFSHWSHGKVEVRVTPNRGRDIAPKLFGFGDVYRQYELILHVHSKMSAHEPHLAHWRTFLLENLIGTKKIVESIISLFIQRPDLGMVGSQHFEPIRHWINWGRNYDVAALLAERMGISLSEDAVLDFPSGSMFWARPTALKPLLDLEMTFEDFDRECGQTDGTIAHAIEHLYYHICEQAGFIWIKVACPALFTATPAIIPINSTAALDRFIDNSCIKLIDGKLPSPRTVAPAPIVRVSESLTKCSFKNGLACELDAFLERGARLQFATVENPRVSIIVVLHNQAPLTFGCLKAIIDTVYLPVEVIVVDNASTDQSEALLDRLDGVHIIHNAENIHYLRAVNQAAHHARGASLLLLNNDAFLRPGALASAEETLCSNEDVGAVGGKVMLLNGMLQEAGSIIWNDGSCVGYGRGLNPAAAEFQFQRDVDYCSGAFLLVKRGIFERLGGFDLSFSPAYYEETDFCVRLHHAGYRVVYDPRVEISHYEFGSSSSPQDAATIQQRNHLIFRNRQGIFLTKHQKAPGTPQLFARMAEPKRGRILMIDDQVPFPSLGAGYPRTAHILTTLHEAGWFVTFYPLNSPDGEWGAIYRSFPREVEFMLGHGQTGLTAFLRDRAGYYSKILVSRPHNMNIFLNSSQRIPGGYCNSDVIYDAEAVFAHREILRLALAGTPLKAADADTLVRKELSLAKSAKSIITVNQCEAALFYGAGHQKVHVVGHAIEPQPTSQSFTRRRDILFVGALDDEDSPNTDSVLWFVHQVMPELDIRIGTDYKFLVLGRCKAKRVKDLASERVSLLGLVEDTYGLYNSARIFVAPTRYAAGIPHKVHECASRGLPMVATDLLAKQLNWHNEIELLTAATPERFAARSARLYTDPILWKRVRDAALFRVTRDCDKDNFKSALLEAL